ncbi:MAG: alpha/beta hydrolase [Cellulomonadaceae bacterium]|nr:alpha/beta hydrolase [Cellulomonadaceae bacterium]
MSTTIGSTASHGAPRHDERTGATPAPPDRLGRITVLSMGTGAVTAGVLALGVLGGGTEARITGAALLGFAVGWALLALCSTRFTARPQRWAAVPATVLAATGTALVVVAPGDADLTTAGWVWGPVMLTLAVWSTIRARRTLRTPARTWVVLPALALLAVASIGGVAQTVRVTGDAAAYPAPGRLVEVDGHQMHLDCTGTGSPTVVLESGLGGTSTLWSRITAQVGATTRVCAYDRAGQAWSEASGTSRDGTTIAAELRTLLATAGEAGPFVLVGHSSGGPYVMAFAAQHPHDVAGMVLLDATNPYDVDASLAGRAGGASGPIALLPSLARTGIAQLAPASFWSALPAPTADVYRSQSATAAAAANTVAELADYRPAFAQAQLLTTLGTRPLVVLTLADKAQSDPEGYAAQQRFAALSSHSSLRTADSTHVGLLDDPTGSAASAQAIVDTVTAVRTGTAVPRS